MHAGREGILSTTLGILWSNMIKLFMYILLHICMDIIHLIMDIKWTNIIDLSWVKVKVSSRSNREKSKKWTFLLCFSSYSIWYECKLLIKMIAVLVSSYSFIISHLFNKQFRFLCENSYFAYDSLRKPCTTTPDILWYNVMYVFVYVVRHTCIFRDTTSIHLIMNIKCTNILHKFVVKVISRSNLEE